MRFSETIFTIATAIDTKSLPRVTADNARLMIIYNTIIAIFASVALVVLIIAGLRYIASVGDPTVMTKAKNTIIYASVGLMVTFLAFVIVNFVVSGI